MVDVIIVAILVCIIGGILFYLYRAKKRGKSASAVRMADSAQDTAADMAKRPNTRRNIDPLTEGDVRLGAASPSPQKGGTAMGTENIILLVLVVVVVAIGLWSTVRHFRGKGGGCCGGGDYKPRKKKLPHVAGQKTFQVEGMHCEHCKVRVEEAVNDIKGAAGKVDLKKGLLTVSYAESLDDEQVKQKVERAGYHLTGTR